MEECTTASPADGGAARQHRLAGPTPAIATSRRVPANEAPAHGFSGGHLLLKGYQYQQTVDEIRLLFDACGLEGHGERRRESYILALIPYAWGYLPSLHDKHKHYCALPPSGAMSPRFPADGKELGHARTRPAYFEDWARSRTSVKQRPQVWPTGAYRIRPKAYPYATAPTGPRTSPSEHSTRTPSRSDGATKMRSVTKRSRRRRGWNHDSIVLQNSNQ